MSNTYTETTGSFFVKFELHGRWMAMQENLRTNFQNYSADYSINDDTYIISFFDDTTTDRETIDNFRQFIEETGFARFTADKFPTSEKAQALQGIIIIICFVVMVMIVVQWASRASFGCENWVNIMDICIKSR